MEEVALVGRENVQEITTTLDVLTTDAKRKWENFCKGTEHDLKDASNFSAAKHCRIELELQQWSVQIGFSIPLRSSLKLNFFLIPHVYLNNFQH